MSRSRRDIWGFLDQIRCAGIRYAIHVLPPERERVISRAVVSNRAYQARVAAARHSWIRRHSEAGAELPVWTSRGAWVETLRKWTLTSDFKQACAELNISIAGATVVAVAAVWSTFADHGTGRNAAVTRARIAAAIGCNPKTVTRTWKVLAAARFAVEVYHGHGSATAPGYGKRPSIWHLVSRQNANTDAVENVPLPPIGGCSSESPVGTNSPRVRKRTPNRICRNVSGRRSRATPRPLAVQRFAGQFVAQTQGLGLGHIGAICDAFTASGLDLDLWTVKDVRAALDADMRAMNWHWPDKIANPAGFLLTRLRRLPARPSTPIHEAKPVSRCANRTVGPAAPLGQVQSFKCIHPAPDDGCCARCGTPGAQPRPFLPPGRSQLCQSCWES